MSVIELDGFCGRLRAYPCHKAAQTAHSPPWDCFSARLPPSRRAWTQAWDTQAGHQKWRKFLISWTYSELFNLRNLGKAIWLSCCVLGSDLQCVLNDWCGKDGRRIPWSFQSLGVTKGLSWTQCQLEDSVQDEMTSKAIFPEPRVGCTRLECENCLKCLGSLECCECMLRCIWYFLWLHGL